MDAKTTVPRVEATRVLILKENGYESTVYMDAKREDLPLGSFSAECAPEAIRFALGHLARDAVRFDVAKVSIPQKGNARGI